MTMLHLFLGLLLAVALFVPSHSALAAPFDPAEASLTENDLPGYVLDEANTATADYGPVSYFQAAFRSDAGLEEPVSTIVNLIGLSRVGPIAGLLENTMAGMLGDAGEGGGQEVTAITGPSIGERSRWYSLILEEDGVRYQGYAVGLVQSDGIAILSVGGPAGVATMEQTAGLATLIAERLFNPNR